MPPIVFNVLPLDFAFPGASAPLSSRRGGRYPNSRQQPVGLGGVPGICAGSIAPLSLAGRSPALLPRRLGHFQPFPSQFRLQNAGLRFI